jgi:hypothetical protein
MLAKVARTLVLKLFYLNFLTFLFKITPWSARERFGMHGKPIEHTIDLDANSQPYSAQPRRKTPAKMLKYEGF